MPNSSGGDKKNLNDGCLKLKERHIVSWTQQEDDILREQITNHGTENWANIAAKFTDKTTRQCRRRWYTYLNSDFKKGGWSPEEDILLCEAQKIFGNRWTEIAKVVSGRTDNAVKNRFSTLCKKRAKHEALEKENKNAYINLNNKRILIENCLYKDIDTGPALPIKKMRMTQIANLAENGDVEKIIRPPLAVLDQNIQNVGSLLSENQLVSTDNVSIDAHINKNQGTFLKKDDPKITALLEQAELLSSLALKVNTENTDQSLENAWKILQDFLGQTKQNDEQQCKFPDMEFPLEFFMDLIEDLRTSNEETKMSLRQTDLNGDSPDSSEYSTGSTLLSNIAEDKTEQSQLTNKGEFSLVSHDPNSIDEDFSSPVQVIPQFTSLAAGIPTPIFSESEKNFLIKTLGVELSNDDHLQAPPPPPCKRALLHSL